MLCEKFELRLQTLLDARQRPEDDDEIQAHAAVCPDCRLDLAAQERLFQGLDLFDPPVPSSEFAQRVIEQLAESRSRIWSDTPRIAVMAIAALLLVALVPAIRVALSNRSMFPESSPLVQTTQRPVPSGAMVAQPSPDDFKSGTPPQKDALASVAQKDPVAPMDLDHVAPVSVDPHHEPQSLLDELRESLSSVSAEPLESVDQITAGFRPIASSLQTAINVLWRSLPVGKELRTPKTAPDTSRISDRGWIA